MRLPLTAAEAIWLRFEQRWKDGRSPSEVLIPRSKRSGLSSEPICICGIALFASLEE